ncbi:hypothetical protein CAPTEDRAFT_200435 [Capitella teleta]|uniref:G-protein coupled receptors family 3 profile domain-containing protein n=1 Tax=Capitella teleta TaxID=283909 RepID=R7UFY3_CAPTE|nr:hypothetical protein CAPTEDRAFT_200435 [Capitella teleta]|eukprot:ELU05003.1 hypothetical protein CAPTEDRAFT_200435 [Capitella teleta]
MNILKHLVAFFNLSYKTLLDVYSADSKYGLIKLSSPRINSLIAFGCGLSYASVLMYGAHTAETVPSDYLCMTRVVVLVYGFSFAFGGMFSKTWRVHVLFTNKKMSRKIVKDAHLFAIVFGLILIDTLLLVAWLLINPLHWDLTELPDELNENDPGLVIRPRVYVCSSENSVYWSGVMYGMKALLVIFGIFFAWETRKVTIEALNDSRQIGLCVYNVMIMSAVGVPLVSLLSVHQVSIAYGVTALAIFLGATTTLVLVFGSKMLHVLQNGNRVEDVLPFASKLRTQTRTLGPSDPSHVTQAGSSHTGTI